MFQAIFLLMTLHVVLHTQIARSYKPYIYGVYTHRARATASSVKVIRYVSIFWKNYISFGDLTLILAIVLTEDGK